MKTHWKICIICFQLLLVLGLWFGTQATATADKVDEGITAYFDDIYQKALGLFKTLIEDPKILIEDPVVFLFAALIGIVVIVLPAIKILSLLLIGESKPENQKKHDADPPLELLKNQKKFDAEPPLELLAKSKYNKTKEIRDAEIALYDLWYDKYFWGDPSDMKAIGHKSGEIELSPIEKIFYMNFMKHKIQSDPKIGGGSFDFTWLRCQQFIDPQTGKKLGSQNLPEKYFILDFLIEYWFSNPTYKLAAQIAVELDGHDFHEKTKEQAKRDKEKDRVLQTHGYLVARFTGSEVYKDPMEVIEKIDRMANKWVLKTPNRIAKESILGAETHQFSGTDKMNDHDSQENIVLSVPAGTTKHIIGKYHIHSCPDHYNYETTKYIAFRAAGGGKMDAIYRIDKILKKSDLKNTPNSGLNEDEISRYHGFLKENPYSKNDRFYFLKKSYSLPHEPRPPKNSTATIYYHLNDLLREEIPCPSWIAKWGD